MASLGSFGAAIRELEPDGERDEFEFFGETFTVEGMIPGIVDLKISAGMSGELSRTESYAAVFEGLRHALTKPAEDGAEPDESQWERFYLLASQRRCELYELIKLCMHILGTQAGRPTGQRSTSAPGSLPTSTNSSSSATPSASPPAPDSAG